jgi:hypothetical protein
VAQPLGNATVGIPDEGRLLAPVSSHTAARTRRATTSL